MIDASFESELKLPVIPARAWHIYFDTAYPPSFTSYALFDHHVFVKCVARLATVSVPLLRTLHRSNHTLSSFLLASMSTGQAAALLESATSLAFLSLSTISS